jgi:hypothetical protein
VTYFRLKSCTAAAAQIRLSFRRISPEEYDEAVQRVPHQCPLLLAGDWRTGAQLLADAPVDSMQTIEALVAGRAGRAALDALAASINRRAEETELAACLPDA